MKSSLPPLRRLPWMPRATNTKLSEPSLIETAPLGISGATSTILKSTPIHSDDLCRCRRTMTTRIISIGSPMELMMMMKMKVFIISFDPLFCFFLSSGTTSMKPKLIPYFDSAPSKSISYLAHLGSSAIQRRMFPSRPTINKSLWFIYSGNMMTTKGGFKAMPASTLPLSGNKESQSQFLSTCIAPIEVVLGSNLPHQIYCHLLCGLRGYESIDSVRAPYAISLIKAFSLLETKWEQLCKDIEFGFVTYEITDATMRDSVNEFLGGPQPKISNWVRSSCQEMKWDGIVGKLWPNARFIRCIATGSMQQYYKKLKYYAGKLRLLGGEYFASECCVGINLDSMKPPDSTRFVILPTAAYFEFLRFDLNNDDTLCAKETVDISGVELGKMYEVVVTTYRSLYRYCLGDVVKVVGFHNSSPEVEFIMRAPKSLNEIFTERDLMRAIDNLQLEMESASMGMIVEFASFWDIESETKRLIIFIELAYGSVLVQKENKDEYVAFLTSCCSTIEDGLGEMYKLKKVKGEIATLTLLIVRPGTFDLVLQKAIENGAPASQYKPPKIIRNRKIADFIEEKSTLKIVFY